MSKQNYTICFNDGSFLTFLLTQQEFDRVKEVFISAKTHVVLDEVIISKSEVRFITKREEEEQTTQAGTPEYLQHDVWEYLKELERGGFNG
jgi:hypothetical protein